MKTNRFIQTIDQKYYNTVTKQYLPKDASEADLRLKYFLEEQEEDCIHSGIFKNPKHLQMTLIPTWECNLRCQHCSVLYQLKKNDNKEIDIVLLTDFIKKYNVRYQPEQASFLFLGGEALLRSKQNYEIIKSIKDILSFSKFRMTTNLSVKMTEDHIRFLNHLDTISISIDGHQKAHNEQRKSLNGNKDIYSVVINNLKELVSLGWTEKLFVQASVSPQYSDIENKKQFYREMLMLGLIPSHIDYRCIFPTKQNPNPSQDYTEALSDWKSNHPCCNYRYMSFFVLDNNNQLYADYNTGKGHELGKINSELSAIEKQYKSLILGKMPMLFDSTCMKECSAVGYCWGGCKNGRDHLQNGPSKYCNRLNIEKQIKESFAKNQLPKFGRFK